MRFAPLLLLLACHGSIKDDTGGGGGGDDTGVTGDGFCAVQSVLNDNCTICHDNSTPSGDLDLENDPWTRLVSGTSQYAGQTLVIPGDPDNSFLWIKLQGTQDTSEGDPMPPSGTMGAAELDAVYTWILDGAPETCGDTDTGGGDYHPEGWDDPTAHGMGAKLQEDDCQACHGETLEGGDVGVSCDTCHEEGWRTDCTFCHGGIDDSTGAPPEGIRDETSDASLDFPAHGPHVQDTDLHDAFGCEQCHENHTSIFDAGHIFGGDTTPGVADTDFSASLSDAGSWSGSGCSNLYCHGDGRRDNGTVDADDDVSCGDCHETTLSENTDLSEPHGDHFEEGATCVDCHAADVDAAREITDPSLHVNGEVDIEISASGITRSGDTCTGACHGEDHRSESW